MKTTKGFIGLPILALIAALLIGGGAFVYVQNKKTNQPVVAQSVIASQDTGKILLGDKANYKNLSSAEKVIVDDYYGKDVVSGVPKMYQRDALSAECNLKYYDSARVLIGCANPTTTFPLRLVNRSDWKEVDELSRYLNLYGGGYLELKDYAISVEDSGIYYYKAGDDHLTLIPNSKLNEVVTINDVRRPGPYEETYRKYGEMTIDYDVSFSESTKTLTVSIFRNTEKGVSDNSKTRTVKFVLP